MADESLVASARRGDDDARRKLVDEYHERVQRYLLTMLADANAADDMTQEAFRLAFEKLDTLRDDARFGSWLYSIAINLCRAELKRRVEHGDEALEIDPASPRGSVLSSVVRRESVAAIAIAIDRLPILLREAFVLKVLEGMTYAEAAEITSASEAALQVRVHRGKALLRTQLGNVVDTYWSEAAG